MHFSVQPATITDSPDIAAFSIAAFKDDPIIGLIRRELDADTRYAYSLARIEARFNSDFSNCIKNFKVVDNNNGMAVAFARWQYPHNPTSDGTADKAALGGNEIPKPKGYNVELEEKLCGAIDEFEHRWVDKTKDYILLGLVVSPAYQRLGLGSLLLREGLVAPDKAGARTFVESSVAGLSLYLRHGWEQINDILIDTTPYGGSSIVSEKCLMREPAGQ